MFEFPRDLSFGGLCYIVSVHWSQLIIPHEMCNGASQLVCEWSISYLRNYSDCLDWVQTKRRRFDQAAIHKLRNNSLNIDMPYHDIQSDTIVQQRLRNNISNFASPEKKILALHILVKYPVAWYHNANFLHDRPWIPGNEKSIFTVVIH